MKRTVLTATLFTFAMMLIVSPAPAQEPGDAKRGLFLAQMTCARCHEIRKGQLRSRTTRAPTFETIATSPGITPMAFRAALRTSHREMPNLVLQNTEIDDLIAYIDTLK
jgi:mono/diheme cytochrome c family protein